MIRLLSGISLFLMSFLAYALEDTMAPPVQTGPVNSAPAIIFGVIFFGIIIGFFWFMCKKEQERKKRESGNK